MKTLLTGIQATFGRIFGSRKMLLAIISLAVLVVVNLAPELQTRAEMIGNLMFAIVSVAIFGITVEDSVDKWTNRPKTVTDMLNSMTTELKAPVPQPPVPTTPPAPPPAPILLQPGEMDKAGG